MWNIFRNYVTGPPKLMGQVQWMFLEMVLTAIALHFQGRFTKWTSRHSDSFSFNDANVSSRRQCTFLLPTYLLWCDSDQNLISDHSFIYWFAFNTFFNSLSLKLCVNINFFLLSKVKLKANMNIATKKAEKFCQ